MRPIPLLALACCCTPGGTNLPGGWHKESPEPGVTCYRQGNEEWSCLQRDDGAYGERHYYNAWPWPYDPRQFTVPDLTPIGDGGLLFYFNSDGGIGEGSMYFLNPTLAPGDRAYTTPVTHGEI